MPPNPSLMDANAIISRVSLAKSQRDLPDLIRDLESADPKLIFDTLFPISIREQGSENGPVAFSAYALYALNPPCPLTCAEAVAAIIDKQWNISIEEVPWYLVNQFGSKQLLRAIEIRLENEADKGTSVRLNSLRYWVNLSPSAA